MNSGATTVFMPGFYAMNSTVTLGPKVRRVVGIGGWVDYLGKAKPDFRIADGESPVVVFEHFSYIHGGIDVNTNRTIYLRSVSDCDLTFGPKGKGGELFFEDVVTHHLMLTGQKVWARQLNVENEGTHVTNNGGDFWVLGYKTERGGTLLETRGSGRSEILGGFSYTTTAGKLAPMFVTHDASVFTFFNEVCYNGDPFATLVFEVQGSESKTLPGRSRILLLIRRELNKTHSVSLLFLGATGISPVGIVGRLSQSFICRDLDHRRARALPLSMREHLPNHHAQRRRLWTCHSHQHLARKLASNRLHLFRRIAGLDSSREDAVQRRSENGAVFSGIGCRSRNLHARAPRRIEEITSRQTTENVSIGHLFTARFDHINSLLDQLSGQRNVSGDHHVSRGGVGDNVLIGDVRAFAHSDAGHERIVRRSPDRLVGHLYNGDLQPRRGRNTSSLTTRGAASASIQIFIATRGLLVMLELQDKPGL